MPSGNPGQPRPNTRTFRDDFSHSRHVAWHRARSQAHYRGEEWLLTIEEFFYFWPTPEAWAERGRARDAYVLSRIDPLGPWSFDNCQRISRLEQLRLKNQMRIGAL